uniref:O-methyltransferase C-terminal domain-containing protein n=1 Tax=Leersia perrieri TaxID=77586 RepID=A0A0D9WY94_9ORYZ
MAATEGTTTSTFAVPSDEELLQAQGRPMAQHPHVPQANGAQVRRRARHPHRHPRPRRRGLAARAERRAPIPTCKQPFLPRLMRMLAASGVFTAVDATTYGLTPLSYILVEGVRVDGDAHQEAIVLSTSSKYHVEAAMGLAAWFRKNHATPNSPQEQGIPSSFEDVHGVVAFEESMARLDPVFDRVFHQALAAHDHMGIGVLLRQCGAHVFGGGLQSLTDCCGGDGTTARAIARAFPHVKCTVLELEHVIKNAPREEDGAVTYVAGDMFQSVPPSQAVMLKLVLHFWSDEDSVKILSQCKKAIPSRADGGKVIIIDIVVGSSSGPMLETELLMDMLMLHNLYNRPSCLGVYTYIALKK